MENYQRNTPIRTRTHIDSHTHTHSKHIFIPLTKASSMPSHKRTELMTMVKEKIHPEQAFDSELHTHTHTLPNDTHCLTTHRTNTQMCSSVDQQKMALTHSAHIYTQIHSGNEIQRKVRNISYLTLDLSHCRRFRK